MRRVEARLSASQWSRAALAAVLLGVALIAGAGCMSQLDRDVEQKLEEADSHQKSSIQDIQKFEASYADLKKIFEEPFGADTVARARAALGAGQASLKAALTEVQEMEKILLEVKDMPVSPDMKTYCDMKVGALSEQEQAVDLELKATQVLGQAIDQFEAGGDMNALLQQVGELEGEAQKHAEEANRLHQEANDFFDEKKLS